MRRPTDFAGVLRVLSAHDVRFVLVGGVAAVIEGAPVTTFDLDIVHDRRRENLERLEGALIVLLVSPYEAGWPGVAFPAERS